MLRGVLGDATFFAAFADYRAQYEGKSVTTAQFQAVMEATSGRDLDWFFNEWVYGVDRPKYRVSTLSEPTLAGTRLYVHLDQTQTTGGFFTMPVPIRVQAGGAHDVVLWNDPDHEDLVVDLPASPSSTTVDPDSWILRTVTSGAYRLNLVSADLADAPAQEFVSVPLVARGGVPPYQWSLVDAAPPGISLDPNTGVLSGIPTLPGDYAFRVHVDDSANPEATDTQRIFWTITPATVSAEAIEVPASGVVRITPNPASGTIHLACSAAGDHSVRWTVHDLAGRRVAAHTGGPEWSWDGRGTGGASLPAGLYLVRAHGAATQASGHVYLLR